MDSQGQKIKEFEVSEELKKVVEFIENVMNMIEAGVIDYQLEEESENDYSINFNCKENAIIIGKKGAVLTSLQMIFNSYVRKNQFPFHVSIDIGGYRKKQNRILKDEVYKVSQKVKQTGVSYLMEGPYSPLERKQIHLHVKSIEGLKSYSEGEGFLKSVWVDKESM